jgi:preprotein translocase subunit YajC
MDSLQVVPNITDQAIKLKEAGFSFDQIVTIILLGVFMVVIWFMLRNNTNSTKEVTIAVKEISEGIKTLIMQSNGKMKNEDETEKYIDRTFSTHIDKKWILLCDLMDENGFSDPERVLSVKDSISRGFDTITLEEKDELNEYLLSFANKILKSVGTLFHKDYLKIRENYLNKVYEIIFSDSKRTVKKREFYSLCRGYLMEIKEKLKG